MRHSVFSSNFIIQLAQLKLHYLNGYRIKCSHKNHLIKHKR
ncbi:hypothetical protein PANA5342_0815 [Pantoea ananatis LMG 5342]|nr:hypothetical protein PANA5342_0815 [Pantoea ananatis LMG 5342]